MPSDSIKIVTKRELEFLNSVFEYRSRTVAILFVKNTEDLLDKWEGAQFELSSQYQYHTEGMKIWDYYLVICCGFDEGSLENELRFRIENDRFCCRKIFLFNCTLKNYSEEKIIQELFPKIHSPGKIEILEPTKFIPSIVFSESITKDFFVNDFEDRDIENLASKLIEECVIDD